MLHRIKEIKEEIENFKPKTEDAAEEFRLRYLARKGAIPSLFADFRNIPPEEKKYTGRSLNEIKQRANDIYNNLKTAQTKTEEAGKFEDHTLPADPLHIGAHHPVNIVRKEIIDVFARLGFVVAEGPEIEDDWHVFSALNFPPEHPARDMQDTFFVSEDRNYLLRTHTSSVQVRVMESQKPPIRIIAPGRVFRNEAISARAHCIFHQIEGLYIDTEVSFADMKQVLLYFAHEIFGQDTRVRLRPSYFPFTEPSAEMDVSCTICGGKGCNVCKYTGWLEIMGCGMVDPAVLSNCHINPETYTGYAFGMGIERVAMLKYQINDLRLYFENDKRFLNQFSTHP